MKAMCLLGPERFELREDYPEVPPPGDDEVTVRVRSVGICGSDLHLYQEGHIGDIGRGQPVVPGHEFMGEIVAAGPRARDGLGETLAPGRRVAVEPHIPCHRCEWCERGDVNLCPHHTFIGLPGFDGALRERLTVSARNCFSIPDTIGDAAGALLEPLGVALHALELSGNLLGRRVAVIGCGPIGLKILRLCRLAGASQVAGIEPIAARAEMARRWGADEVLETAAQESVAEAREISGGRGFDLVFECAWTGPALPPAIDIAAPGARVMLVGIPGRGDTVLSHSPARRKGLSLIFVRRMKHTYPRAIDLAARGERGVALDDLVTHRFPLQQTPQAFALNLRYGDNLIKAVIDI